MSGVILAGGLAALAFSVLIAFNTSAGGTRSDYVDGSGMVAGFGLLLTVIGIAGLVIEWIQQ